uniref:FCP1 homology domain-containing protein n=1 Tax=Arundo donax TaxID=35708 RepID=A0A0A9DJH7_ARUDO
MLKDVPDSTLLSSLPFKPNGKITMVGTVEEEIFVGQEDAPEVLDDFDFEQNEVTAIKDKDVYKQKLKRRASQYKIKLLNPCRKGKKLLVLDIDYTLFDHRSPAENPKELMRPYLHQFLASAYSEYDIMIWSATSMKWVELKMEQLGVLSNPDYKITALMDHLAMITVQSENLTKKQTFDCKPLGVIWAQFPEYYNEKNTIMFDDLRRNFVMNPQNGLVIKPFKKAHSNRDNDQELAKLTQYLLAIADLEDLSRLDHRKWESFIDEVAKRHRHR